MNTGTTYKLFKQTKIFFAAMFVFLMVGVGSVSGQINTLSAWSNFYHGTGNSSAAYTVPTGSNTSRILVVAIASSTRAAATRTITLSYGGQTFTPIAGDLTTTSRQHTQFYYLNEAGLEAATTTILAFTVTGGTTADNDIFVSVYDFVDQNAPITNSRVYNSGTTPVSPFSFATGLTVNANDLALKIVSSVLTGSTTARTISNFGTNWTSDIQVTSNYNTTPNTNDLGIRNGIGTRAIPTTNTTDVSTVTLSGASLASMTGISLKEAPKYFRSITSGNWNSTTTWEQSYDNSIWVAATSTPTSLDYSILIQNTHTVTLTASTSVDEITIATGGQLTVNSGQTLSIANGTGTDLVVDGTLVNSGTITTTGTIAFNSNSTYEHAQNGGTIPTATWNAASNCSITGITDTAPGGINQTFGNFIMNSARTTWVHFNPSSMVIQGNLEILKTDNNNGNTYDFAIEQDMTIGGNLIIDGGAYRFSYNANRTQSVTGNLIISSGNLFFNTSSTNTYVGTLTVNGNVSISGGTLNLSGSSATGNNGILNVKGNFSQAGGTITETGSATGCAINFTGTSTQTYSGNSTLSNTVNFTVNSGSTLDVGTSIISGSTGTLTVSGTLLVGGVSNFPVFSTTTLNTGSTVNYYRSGDQTIASKSYSNLTLSGSGTKTLAGATGVNGVLTLTSGILATSSSNLLSITNTATSAISGGSSTAYIDGPVRWSLPTMSSSGNIYVFPVGTSTDYKPFTLVNPITSAAVTAQVQATAGSSGGSAGTGLDSISVVEYWTLTPGSSSFTSTSVSLGRTTAISPLNAIAATSPTLNGTYVLYGGTVGTNGVSNSNTVTIGANTWYFVLGKASPLITVSPTSLSFSYAQNNGPSSEQTFSISGSYLTDNILINAPTDYEISKTSGGTFSNNLTLTIGSGGIVSSTTIYVRLKAGLTQGTYNSEVITASSTGATNKTITCNGTVTAPPGVALSATLLSGFSYTFGSGPSSYQSFTVTGSNLVSSITVTPPSGFVIATTSGGTYQSTPITIASSGTIYVKMAAGLGVGSYVDNIVVSSTAVNSQTVTCSGSVLPTATIMTSRSSLIGFIYRNGYGPSGSISFIVTGSNLTANVSVAATTNYQFSTDNTNWNNSLSLTQSGGSINQTVYVRLISGLGTGTYGPSNIQITSSGAVTKNVSCIGYVVSSARLATSTSTLTGFGYQYASTPDGTIENGGPSNEQIVYVSGAYLSNDVTVTPPSNFEISTTSGSNFQLTAITLTRSGTDNRVNPTAIYVRLKSGLAANNYTGNLTVVSSGATTINVGCVGKVYTAPLISAVGGGSYCVGNAINLSSTGVDVTDVYWEGPNSYYVVGASTTVTSSATASHAGDYVVTGNVIVGGNLIYNGDFSLGRTGFGSSYTAKDSATNALWGEGTYAVVTNPQSVHSNFSPCVDNTTGNGRQMVVNGSSTAGVVVWTQSVTVIPGADYQFAYWVQTVCTPSPSILQLYVNGVSAGPQYTANASTCNWRQFMYNTNAGTNSVLNLELVNQNTDPNGNDFALDDIAFKQVLFAKDTASVAVSSNYPVSVSIAASQNPSTTGATVTFTATPTNGGTPPTSYAWYVNGSVVSTGTSSTYSYVPANSDLIKCVLTSSLSCTTGNPATSNIITMVVNAATNYWKGTTSTDWGTPSNWTAGTVPLAGADVIFATVANNGSIAVNDLVLDQDRTQSNLINQTTKNLIIPAGKSLTLNSTITTDNSVDRIYIHSSSTLPNGSLIFYDSNPVYATVEMYSMAYKGAPVTVKNPYPPYDSITTSYRWQYFGIPINGVTASPTFDGSYVRRWDESGSSISNHWVSVNNEYTLQPLIGYEITQDAYKTIIFQGQLSNTDLTSPQLTYTSSGALLPGRHVLANPFTAALDIKKIIWGSDMQESVWLYTTGSFGDWSSFGSTSPGGYVVSTKQTAGDYGIEAQVPSMQGMIVQFKVGITVSTSNSFVKTPYNAAVRDTSMQRIKGNINATTSEKVSLRIDVKSSKSSDKLWIFTDSNCTRNFDNGWDGPKVLGDALSPQIYAIEKDGIYQIDAVPDMNNTILAFQAGQDVEDTLTFTNYNLEKQYAGVYLVDLLENRTIDITTSGTQYAFMAESTPTPVTRFKIVTRPYEKNAPDAETQVKVFSAGNSIYVQNFGSADGECRVYDIAGHYLMKVPFSSNNVTTITNSLRPGAYIATAITGGEKVSKRLIVQ